MAIRSDRTYLSMGTDFQKTPVSSARVLPYCLETIKEENIIRVVSMDVNGDYQIAAKLQGQKEWTPIYVGTGTVDTTLDISLYDAIRIETLTPITEGTLAVSGFFIPGGTTLTPTGGDATAANQVAGNSILGDILNELVTNPELECVQNPVVINLDIPAVGAIYDISLPVDTKKFIIRHRDSGNIEFAFENTLSTYFTVRKGNAYKEEDLCLTNTIIYLRSSKAGTIELIAWT